MKSPFDNPLAGAAPAATPAPAAPRAGMRPPQIDGNRTTAPVEPTKGPLQTRVASPAKYNTSGIERSMGALADKMHSPKRR